MAYLIKIKKSTFSVSKSVVSAITKNNLNFEVINRKGKQIYLLEDSCFLSFTAVSTSLSKHFFIKIHNSVKLRVNKALFEFVALNSKQHEAEKTQNTKTLTLPSLNKCNDIKTITTPLG